MAIVLVLEVLYLLIVDNDGPILHTTDIKRPSVVVIVEMDSLDGPDGIRELQDTLSHLLILPMPLLILQDLLVIEPFCVMLGIGSDFNGLLAIDNLLSELLSHNQVQTLHWLWLRKVRVLGNELFTPCRILIEFVHKSFSFKHHHKYMMDKFNMHTLGCTFDNCEISQWYIAKIVTFYDITNIMYCFLKELSQ